MPYERASVRVSLPGSLAAQEDSALLRAPIVNCRSTGSLRAGTSEQLIDAYAGTAHSVA